MCSPYSIFGQQNLGLPLSISSCFQVVGKHFELGNVSERETQEKFVTYSEFTEPLDIVLLVNQIFLINH